MSIKIYSISTDWSGKNTSMVCTLIGLMMRFLLIFQCQDKLKKLLKFQHPIPSKPQQSPFRITGSRPFRSGHRQYAPGPERSLILDAIGSTMVKIHVQVTKRSQARSRRVRR